MTIIAATRKRVWAAVIAAVVLAGGSGAALAQQFEKVENLPQQTIPAERFVAIAYGIIWLAILVYVAFVASGLRRANEEIADLKRKLGSKS